jgi:tungstate transport system substrate-binding protein
LAHRVVTVAAALGWLAACDWGASRGLDLATTTSVHNSGLLAALTAAYPEPLRAHAAGSGRALEMLADGIVNVVISHAPGTEARYLAAHADWAYRKFAYNQYVLVGPPEDPAQVSAGVDVVDAFSRIAASGAPFVSRGDGSGTHEREDALWALAGVKPDARQLIVSGRGMAVALRHADERSAYTLSDDATFWQFEKQLQLAVLVSGDPRLLNTYAVIHPAGDVSAAAFARWLTAGPGTAVIAAFQVAGRQGFTLWPAGCAGDRPESRVCTTER